MKSCSCSGMKSCCCGNCGTAPTPAGQPVIVPSAATSPPGTPPQPSGGPPANSAP
jgi:hypothetical protein